jgi:AcrR family transcriptional regulator
MSEFDTDGVLPNDRDIDMVRGFLAYDTPLKRGEMKHLASRLRARCVAAALATERGIHDAPVKTMALRAGISDRNLHQMFTKKDAIYAFPPPEFAAALVDTASRATDRHDLRDRVLSLFEALDDNDEACNLFFQLSVLYEEHENLKRFDSNFAYELRAQIERFPARFNPDLFDLFGYFTDRCRKLIVEWAKDPDQSITIVGEELISKLFSIHNVEIVIFDPPIAPVEKVVSVKAVKVVKAVKEFKSAKAVKAVKAVKGIHAAATGKVAAVTKGSPKQKLTGSSSR